MSTLREHNALSVKKLLIQPRRKASITAPGPEELTCELWTANNRVVVQVWPQLQMQRRASRPDAIKGKLISPLLFKSEIPQLAEALKNRNERASRSPAM